MSYYLYRKSNCGDKTATRSSHLHNGKTYTGETTSLYWIRALSFRVVCIKTPRHGISFCITGPLWGDLSPVDSPHNEPVIRIFYVFVVVRNSVWNKRRVAGYWDATVIITHDDVYINEALFLIPSTLLSETVHRTSAWTAPSHYLNQYWNIVNWTLRNKFQWNFNPNSNIFIQENAPENVVCEMASILSRPQWVNQNKTKTTRLCCRSR